MQEKKGSKRREIREERGLEVTGMTNVYHMCACDFHDKTHCFVQSTYTNLRSATQKWENKEKEKRRRRKGRDEEGGQKEIKEKRWGGMGGGGGKERDLYFCILVPISSYWLPENSRMTLKSYSAQQGRGLWSISNVCYRSTLGIIAWLKLTATPVSSTTISDLPIRGSPSAPTPLPSLSPLALHQSHTQALWPSNLYSIHYNVLLT